MIRLWSATRVRAILFQVQEFGLDQYVEHALAHRRLDAAQARELIEPPAHFRHLDVFGLHTFQDAIVGTIGHNRAGPPTVASPDGSLWLRAANECRVGDSSQKMVRVAVAWFATVEVVISRGR
jgi:hypothetical protein